VYTDLLAFIKSSEFSESINERCQKFGVWNKIVKMGLKIFWISLKFRTLINHNHLKK